MSKCKISARPLKLCKSDKMQGAEIEDEGSVLTYMTKSEIEGQRSSLLIMTQRHFFVIISTNFSSRNTQNLLRFFWTEEHKNIFFSRKGAKFRKASA